MGVPRGSPERYLKQYWVEGGKVHGRHLVQDVVDFPQGLRLKRSYQVLHSRWTRRTKEGVDGSLPETKGENPSLGQLGL